MYAVICCFADMGKLANLALGNGRGVTDDVGTLRLVVLGAKHLFLSRFCLLFTQMLSVPGVRLVYGLLLAGAVGLALLLLVAPRLGLAPACGWVMASRALLVALPLVYTIVMPFFRTRSVIVNFAVVTTSPSPGLTSGPFPSGRSGCYPWSWLAGRCRPCART